jgi:hypothetical protein
MQQITSAARTDSLSGAIRFEAAFPWSDSVGDESSPSPRPSPPGRGRILASPGSRSPFGEVRKLEPIPTKRIAAWRLIFILRRESRCPGGPPADRGRAFGQRGHL